MWFEKKKRLKIFPYGTPENTEQNWKMHMITLPLLMAEVILTIYTA